MKFVESKSIDWARVQAVLAVSEQENHWTNFGPVSLELERAIAQMLQVPPARSVVVASSCTSALFAVLGASAARAGRPLRWLVSAFGFASTRIGPLANMIRFVDCDDQGMLDLEQAARVPADEWDGLLITNVFGQCADFSTFTDFCGKRGKAIVIDSAQCLLGRDRSSAVAPEEVISFHHTKPWGFGEGGCAIVRREDEGLVRRLLNFGYGAPGFLFRYAANGKISDVAAAAILSRLISWPSLAQDYRNQWQRVAAIAKEVGYRIFAQPLAGGAIGFVPAIAPTPTAIAPNRSGLVPLAKYYPPLCERPNAGKLFAQMVCVASHPGIASIDEAVIRNELKTLLDSSD